MLGSAGPGALTGSGGAPSGAVGTVAVTDSATLLLLGLEAYGSLEWLTIGVIKKGTLFFEYVDFVDEITGWISH